MNRARRILIIEDEKDISRILMDYLLVNGYEPHTAESGEEGLRMIERLQPDFIILDIMLPDADGIDLCRQIRERHETPILILSARGSDTDKVLGLGFGADDYMTKPFSLSELVARVNANLRRTDGIGSMTNKKKEEEGIVRAGAIVMDKRAYKVAVEDKEVSLSAKEYELLFFLAEHKNQVFSKSQLLDAIWGFQSYGDENTITVYIRRLREKLEADPSNPVHIRTVWGVGYKFSAE
ncbi:Transcriptional regulatory protein WalR [Paenibacillus plantiphilus]|uniref:Transcriptional regulatory protein WalR n=1 Tax=Paenibacillus plantiphilus TaxID=2905650 RepID=A0ABN8G5Q1_9BACL|nr:response regulator transcription factor [Paenibacillus plantiphilus]CAH1200487.1 Transcriptional regulatory protein WalR [Paenibacillus plantiphilus]